MKRKDIQFCIDQLVTVVDILDDHLKLAELLSAEVLEKRTYTAHQSALATINMLTSQLSKQKEGKR